MRRALVVAVLVAAGCGVSSRSGIGEPIRVREGTFIPGALPGAPDGADGERVTQLNYVNVVVTWNQAGRTLSGLATPGAYSVGVRWAGAGSGYWVVPTGVIDPFTDERVWSLTADFGDGIPTGVQQLEAVVFDEAGRAGPKTTADLCVVSDRADGPGCDPTRQPQVAAIALSWDSDVDLDLVVQTPDGKTVDWRHASTATPVDGRITPEALRAPDVGVLTRNSNAGCVIDHIGREEVVWRAAPKEGPYVVFANLNDACGQPSVSFVATVLRADADGKLVETQRATGQLTALAANGGARLGTRLLEVVLP